jgi:hypothetical protein
VDLWQQVEQRSVGHRQGGSAPGPEGSGTLARVSNWGAASEDGGIGGEWAGGWIGAVFPPPLFCWRAPWSSAGPTAGGRPTARSSQGWKRGTRSSSSDCKCKKPQQVIYSEMHRKKCFYVISTFSDPYYFC